MELLFLLYLDTCLTLFEDECLTENFSSFLTLTPVPFLGSSAKLSLDSLLVISANEDNALPWPIDGSGLLLTGDVNILLNGRLM